MPADSVSLRHESSFDASFSSAAAASENCFSSEPLPTEAELQARKALKDILLPLLKESLRVEVSSGHFTSPNDHYIKVSLDDELITEATFDVCSRPEYEG